MSRMRFHFLSLVSSFPCWKTSGNILCICPCNVTVSTFPGTSYSRHVFVSLCVFAYIYINYTFHISIWVTDKIIVILLWSCFALAFLRLHKSFTTDRGRPYTDTPFVRPTGILKSSQPIGDDPNLCMAFNLTYKFVRYSYVYICFLLWTYAFCCGYI